MDSHPSTLKLRRTGAPIDGIRRSLGEVGRTRNDNDIFYYWIASTSSQRQGFSGFPRYAQDDNGDLFTKFEYALNI